MCNFANGESVVLGHIRKLTILEEMNLPGRLSIFPLVPENYHVREEDPFHGIAVAHVTGIPSGHEVAVLSRISALLSEEILNDTAVADLNYFLPPSAFNPPKTYKFSKPARGWIDNTRYYIDRYIDDIDESLRPIAFIDSGVNINEINNQRKIKVFDYTKKSKIIEETEDAEDRKGHGTSIAKILDSIIPINVHINMWKNW